MSHTVSYAINASVQLAIANPGQPVPCSRLAAQGQMPERFLLQVLRSLVTHGILQSTRGVDGGYHLHRPPEDISLLDIIEAIDGPLGATVASTGGMHPAVQQRLTGALNRICGMARRELAAVKLSHLLPDSKP